MEKCEICGKGPEAGPILNDEDENVYVIHEDCFVVCEDGDRCQHMECIDDHLAAQA